VYVTEELLDDQLGRALPVDPPRLLVAPALIRGWYTGR
jgi:hypothetical protein